MREEVRVRFKEFLAEILRNDEGLEDVAQVTSYFEDSYDIGYCETCSYIVHEIVITYLTVSGEEKTYKLDGNMADWLS